MNELLEIYIASLDYPNVSGAIAVFSQLRNSINCKNLV
jgi:hypothetical protein